MNTEYSLPPGVPPPNLDNAPATPKAADPNKKTFLARKVGAFWVEEDKNKNKYLSGTIRAPDGREERVYLFKVTNKTKAAFPDWEAYLSADDFEARQKASGSKEIEL